MKEQNDQKAILAKVFSRGNTIAVFAVALVPVLLGLLEFAVGSEHSPSGFNQNHFIYNFLYSFLVTASLFYGCAAIITILNRTLPWKGNIWKRLLIEVLAVFTYTSLAQGLILYLLRNTPVFVRELTAKDYFDNILFSNTITLIVVAIIEGIYFFRNWKESLVAAERLKQENIKSQYAGLKSQLDPHFMFNSLNVLSSLIRSDPAKAEKFVDDFAAVYRYLLQVKDEMVVPLKDELEFVRKYLNLQKIRFEEGLQVKISIRDQNQKFLPPLSLQELVGNAVKHNSFDRSAPLHIELYDENDCVIVENNLRRRKHVNGTKTGLNNLCERYKLLSSRQPEFREEKNRFISKIPLIEVDE